MNRETLKAELDANFIEYNQFTDKDSLTTLLFDTIKTRSRIPQLNNDVQGYIVEFLSGFEPLRTASQIATGFRLKAKPKLDLMLKRTTGDIYRAVMDWCGDDDAAMDIYGHISIWNTSEVTNMRDLFSADGEPVKQFNDDISRWDVSEVTYMEWMFYGASSFNGDLSSWKVTTRNLKVQI